MNAYEQTLYKYPHASSPSPTPLLHISCVCYKLAHVYFSSAFKWNFDIYMSWWFTSLFNVHANFTIWMTCGGFYEMGNRILYNAYMRTVQDFIAIIIRKQTHRHTHTHTHWHTTTTFTPSHIRTSKVTSSPTSPLYVAYMLCFQQFIHVLFCAWASSSLPFKNMIFTERMNDAHHFFILKISSVFYEF